MDCLLLQCHGPLRKSVSLKKQWSSKRHTEEAQPEPCRDWPVDPDLYELLEFAGKGAHAVVYKGCCKAYDEVVAIKRLDLDCNWDLTALIREATLMKKFHHPAVLPLYAAFVAGRELWFVTPFMGMGSVRSIMKQHYPQGLDEVVIATIMQPVLLGLEYVHKNAGIHRDVKADNILVSEEGEVVLADFGVASARMRLVSMVNMDVQAVMATTFVGTPCWMAPEVVQQSEEGYHTSADIWSFGITLIELAHGRPPLARMNPLRVLMDTMSKPPPQLAEREEGTCFSKAFKELVEECLNKDPVLRPSAAALLNHKFFRMARDAAFLKQHFLLPLKQQQQQQQSPHHARQQLQQRQQREQQVPGQTQQQPSTAADCQLPAAGSTAALGPDEAAAAAATPAAAAAAVDAHDAQPDPPVSTPPQHQQPPAQQRQPLQQPPLLQQQHHPQKQLLQQVFPSPLGLLAGRVSGAVRAASGFLLSGRSSSSGPSRISSGWVFPLTGANSSQLGSCSRKTSLAPEFANGCSGSGCSRTVSLPPEQPDGQGSSGCSGSGCHGCSGSAIGHSPSLEQQLQPFLLQQQAALGSSSNSSRVFGAPGANTQLESHAEDVKAEEEALAAAAAAAGASAVTAGPDGGAAASAGAVAAGSDDFAASAAPAGVDIDGSTAAPLAAGAAAAGAAGSCMEAAAAEAALAAELECHPRTQAAWQFDTSPTISSACAVGVTATAPYAVVQVLSPGTGKQLAPACSPGAAAAQPYSTNAAAAAAVV